MKIGVSNQTAFKRTQWVRLGTPTEVNDPNLSVFAMLPRSKLCVAKVTVEPYYTGSVDIIPDVIGDTFKVSKILSSTLGEFSLSALINNVEYTIAPKYIIYNGNRIQVSYSQAICPDGFIDLVTYLYHDHPNIEFNGKFVAQNLDTPIKNVNVKLKVNYKGTGTVVLSLYELAKKTTDTIQLFDGQLGDTQGVPFSGVLLFATSDMINNPMSPESQTAAAQMVRPMYGEVPWPKWGIWKKDSPAVSNASVEAAFKIMDTHRPEWVDLTKNLGVIGPDYSGTTGDHSNFGWRFLSDTVGIGNAMLGNFYDVATTREITRPGQFYEADGTYLQASQHSNWVTVDGYTHWHHGVSPDRLGRQHNGGFTGGKTGYDDQHTGYGPAAMAVILHGNILMQQYLKQISQVRIAGLTLPDSNGNWDDIDNPGRAIARTSLDCAFFYLATGDRAVVDRGVKRINEAVYPYWKKKWAVGDVIKPYTLKIDDIKVAPGKWVMVWEDGLACVGVDALSNVAVDLGIDVSKLTEFVTEVSKWIANVGYFPNPVQIVSQMNITAGNTAPTNYSDINLIHDGSGTDYKSWCEGAVEICKRYATKNHDTALIDRCAQVIASLGQIPIQWGGVQ